MKYFIIDMQKSSTNWFKTSTVWQRYIFSNELTARLHIKQCHLNNQNVFQPYVKRKYHPDSWKIYFKSSFLASLKQRSFSFISHRLPVAGKTAIACFRPPWSVTKDMKTSIQSIFLHYNVGVAFPWFKRIWRRVNRLLGQSTKVN